jgi:hypothetical protein
MAITLSVTLTQDEAVALGHVVDMATPEDVISHWKNETAAEEAAQNVRTKIWVALEAAGIDINPPDEAKTKCCPKCGHRW